MDVVIALNKFLKHLKSASYAPSTLVSYKQGILAFCRFLGQSGIVDIKYVNDETIRQYQRVLVNSPLSPESRAVRIRPVKRFFEYLVKINRLLINPASNIVEVSRRRRKIGPVLSENEMAVLLKQPDMKTPIGIRNRAIMEVLYSTGIRIGELLGLQVNDVDLRGGVLYVRKGKGSRQRVVPLGENSGHFLSNYLEQVRPLHKKTTETKALFITNRGSPISATVIRMFLKRYKESAGICTPVTPHLFRRSCATHLLNAGTDIRYVQQLLGHTSLKVTHCYTRVLPVDIKKTHVATHPGIADAGD